MQGEAEVWALCHFINPVWYFANSAGHAPLDFCNPSPCEAAAILGIKPQVCYQSAFIPVLIIDQRDSQIIQREMI